MLVENEGIRGFDESLLFVVVFVDVCD